MPQLPATCFIQIVYRIAHGQRRDLRCLHAARLAICTEKRPNSSPMRGSFLLINQSAEWAQSPTLRSSSSPKPPLPATCFIQIEYRIAHEQRCDLPCLYATRPAICTGKRPTFRPCVVHFADKLKRGMGLITHSAFHFVYKAAAADNVFHSNQISFCAQTALQFAS